MAAGEDRDGDLILGGGNRIPASELVELASRAGGPGGQHVNTSSTRVTLRWNLRETRGLKPEARALALARLAARLTRDGEIVLHASSHRSRHRNREDARARLQALVAAALVVAARRRPTKPSRAAKTRRIESKRRHGATKQRRQPQSQDD
jgi:ribosome-associated protein